MIDRLAQILSARPPRERLLLATLVGAVLPLAYVLLVADPLIAARDAARTERAHAEALVDWYRQTQGAIARLPDPSDAPLPASGPAPIGLAGIEAQLIAAGLRGQTTMLAADGPDALALTLAGVDFAALMDWLGGLGATAGYGIAALTLEPGATPGTVNADLRLTPAR